MATFKVTFTFNGHKVVYKVAGIEAKNALIIEKEKLGYEFYGAIKILKKSK